MVALGLVLLVLSGVFAAGIALSNTDTTDASAFGVTLSDVSLGGLFLLGVAIGAVAVIGLALMLVGAARKRAKRKAVKTQVRDARGEAETLAEQNARLKDELEHERTSSVSPTTGDPEGSLRGKHSR